MAFCPRISLGDRKMASRYKMSPRQLGILRLTVALRFAVVSGFAVVFYFAVALGFAVVLCFSVALGFAVISRFSVALGLLLSCILHLSWVLLLPWMCFSVPLLHLENILFVLSRELLC